MLLYARKEEPLQSPPPWIGFKLLQLLLLNAPYLYPCEKARPHPSKGIKRYKVVVSPVDCPSSPYDSSFHLHILDESLPCCMWEGWLLLQPIHMLLHGAMKLVRTSAISCVHYPLQILDACCPTGNCSVGHAGVLSSLSRWCAVFRDRNQQQRKAIEVSWPLP